MTDARISEIRELLPKGMLADWVRLGARLVRLLRDRHHPDRHHALLDRLLAQARASVELRQTRLQNRPKADYPSSLPIAAKKDEIIRAIRAHPVVIVAGETGSGKTTQIPKMCLEAGLGIDAKIGCTQPRRVAALSISRRIAEELNVAWGREVGCKIRFDDRSSPHTYIKLMTDGVLLAETQGDPLLSDYGALIIDEAHERSLNIDFLLGYLKNLLTRRKDLKLVITSATIDTEAFSRAFNDAPVIEVSGRLYPVDVAYAPIDASSEESGEITFIDAAVRAAEQALCEPGSGDILIFMPGERDIRETCDLMKTRFGNQAEIIPLFGRLSAGDQQRVFAPAAVRKIVVATNIAETSLTIPGIRYVIDSGLARISRYNPRTRIKRLPVETISQSSANQRKGRAGRVRHGLCIRLYAEDDFAGRPPYTQPEIQRANLAEVILRMKAFRLGEIETFPFLNPPTPAAIQTGYTLLQELGALDESRDLTPRGRDLSRLPIDPTLGRMLLQAQGEHATRELLIIAAGLSIQDPRERPLDQKDAATAAHKRFVDPQSDFLTLLNIWNAVHDQWESLRTQNQRRKFCKANFLSYLRMREWQDLHAQLEDALGELGTLRLNDSNADYAAVHRSILSGLLGHVARRTERNLYQGARNRKLMLFPGSALYDRGKAVAARKSRHTKTAPPPSNSAQPNQPEWIMAGEIVETSQLFARTLAGIDPLWIVDLAPHLVKITHQNPHWSAEAGRVLVEEIVTLHGLELHKRKAAYGNINPAHATEIFIRAALVEENLFPEPGGATRERVSTGKPSSRNLLELVTTEEPNRPSTYPFMEHNRGIREKIETWQTRMRRHDLLDVDDALFQFYAQRITDVSSIHELNRFLRGKENAALLFAQENDLTGGQDIRYDADAFPDAVPLAGESVPLRYAYAPGEEQDGVTFRLGAHLAQSLSAASLDWAVPGLREPQVAELLRSLPKSIRRQLMPLSPKVAEIVRELQPGQNSLTQDLSRFIRQRYHVDVPASAWPENPLPQHLKPRIEILSHEQRPLVAGRDLAQLQKHVEQVKVKPGGEDPAWDTAARVFERFGLTQWNFGDLPERLELDTSGPVPLVAWPGLQCEEGHVNVRLFRSQVEARRNSLGGVQRLVEMALQKDLAWLQKDLRALTRLQPLVNALSSEELQAGAFENLRRHVLPSRPFRALQEKYFISALEEARHRLPGLALKLIDRLEAILKLRQELLRRVTANQPKKAAPSRTISAFNQLEAALAVKGAHAVAAGPTTQSPILAELESLLPKDFLSNVPFDQLEHFPRYFKGLITRAERAALNPVKDRERAAQVATIVEAWKKLRGQADTGAGRERLAAFRWMLEEYKVSVFAQELGTAYPVSPKRLSDELQRIREEM